jgi:quinol monooxygenase YgiN
MLQQWGESVPKFSVQVEETMRQVLLLCLCLMTVMGTVVVAADPPAAPSLPERLKTLKLADGPFTLVVEVHIKKESIKIVEPIMVTAAVNTHKEAGCLMYDYHREVEAGEGKYVILERFANLKELEEHMAFDYTKTLLAAFGEHSASPVNVRVIQQFTPVRTGGNK